MNVVSKYRLKRATLLLLLFSLYWLSITILSFILSSLVQASLQFTPDSCVSMQFCAIIARSSLVTETRINFEQPWTWFMFSQISSVILIFQHHYLLWTGSDLYTFVFSSPSKPNCNTASTLLCVRPEMMDPDTKLSSHCASKALPPTSK